MRLLYSFCCCIEEDRNEEFDEFAQRHFTVLRMEASEGGRRSSQLPLEHYIAYESALIIVILTNHEID